MSLKTIKPADRKAAFEAALRDLAAGHQAQTALVQGAR